MKKRKLLIDIETFPNEGYAWGKWEQNIIDYTNHWYVMCVGVQWYGEPGGVHVIAAPDLPGYTVGSTDDSRIIWEIRELLNEADVVIAHNAKDFDVRKIFTRMIQHRMDPPSTFKVIDTLKEARKFGFNSSKLDDISRDMGLGRKLAHNGFPVWLGCHNGDPAAWDVMKKYNKRDVVLLRKWTDIVKPWIGYLSTRGTPYLKTREAF